MASRRKKPRKTKGEGLVSASDRETDEVPVQRPPAPGANSANGAAGPEVPASTAAAASAGGLRYAVRGATDVGRKRENNEDSFLVDEALSLFAVADGMGGHAGGGIASRLAVETLQATLRERYHAQAAALNASDRDLETSVIPELLRDSVESACAAIYKRAQGTPSLSGMGTTLTALMVHGPYAYVAHVGDSRIYLIRRGRILQVSDDHSLVNEQLKAGVITADEAKHSRFKNVITRSVGFEEDVLVDLLGLELEPEDLFVICCDGLSNLVEDKEIAQMAASEALPDLPLRLIGLANDRGGDDNITVVAIRILEVPKPANRQPAA